MELVSAIVGPVMNVLTVHIKQKLGYLTSSTEHVRRMKNRMQILEYQRADIEAHMKKNNLSNRRISDRIPGWLEDVKKIKEDVDKISSNDIRCFNVKKKYLAGRNALRVTKDIEGLIIDGSDIIWRDAEIPFGRINSKRLASTSGGGTQNMFKSRDKTFNDALKLLQQDDDDDAVRVIALCGMGGVGKTTLMKQLKEAAHDNKMFNWIVDVVIGSTPNLLAIQKAIAVQTGEPLTETDETLMTTYLSKRFEVFSERKENILVILDDVWQKIKVEDIGLAGPLPNGVKLLLTSRDVNVCRQIAYDADSALEVFKVDVLEEEEARDFFSRIAGISAEHDHDLYQIGCDIVKRCGCLPLAIKLIAGTLKCQKKFVWRRTLKCLKNNDFGKNVLEIIETSYKNLKREEDKAIFLLCGLFPEGSNIPIEDLTRYAWGLKLLEQVSSMEAARDSIETSVSNLKNAYLLMDGDSHHSDCVKLHDLVLAFVVATVSKGGEDGCWIIHHDDFSKLSEANNMMQFCKQISLACKDMSEFPSEFKFPSLTVLKLMQGDESLRFPQDFYVGMEKLQVIAFEMLKYPLVPTTVQFSANLRTLCLHECSLMFDLNCIGNLLNLEVLSFANSGVTILPSTFGNLKRLRLLDVTGCCYNLVIDDGVLKSLVKLEELYMIPYDEKACCFTDNNSREFAERSENLKRFKLSVRFSFTEVREHVQTYKADMHSYENSLKLVTNREELLKSKINELFEITDALYLQVSDMNTLEDVVVDPPHPQHPPQNSSYYNIRLLVVSQCAELKYLFTPSVITNFSELEYLDISGCPNMEAVIHTENEGLDIIMFSNLKYLRLAELPKLLHFCNNVDAIELPRLMELQLEGLPKFTSIYPDSETSFVSSNISPAQSFLNKEDATPKLEKLFVKDCDSIEVLFNMDFGEIEQLSSGLRSIKVDRCKSLVKLFSCNPFPFFNHLEELEVTQCASIEVIFDIDMRCVAETDKVSSSRLRNIYLWRLGMLREVWRIKDAGNNLIHGFEAVEFIRIEDCERFENLITPTTTNFGMRALKEVNIFRCGRESERKNELVESNQEHEINAILREDSNDEISKVAFPSYLLPTFHNLHKLFLRDYKDVEVVFEIKSPISRESAHNTQQLILPYLEGLNLYDLERMTHVWKCNWNKFLTLQKQPSQCSFHNLTTITMYHCDSIKYLFSPLMAKILSNLKKIDIRYCDGIEEVVSNRDDEDASICSHTTTTFFPHLDLFDFLKLTNFKCIGGGVNGVSSDIHDQLKLPQASWSLCQYAREIRITDCDALSSVIPWYAVGQMQKLRVLKIKNCKSITEVFETQEINKSGTGKSLPRLEYITMLKLPELQILKIQGCNLLKHIFTFSTLKSLTQLKELEVKDCNAMEVIVTEENGEQTTASIVTEENEERLFPHLKSLILVNLPNFVGFFLGKSEFIWPALVKVVIRECPHIVTYGWSTAPNLKILKIQGCSLLKHIFTFSTLKSLTQLEELEVMDCNAMEVIVTEENGEQTTASVVTEENEGRLFPHLKSLILVNLPNFVGFFLGKSEFIWPALEKVVIRECPQIESLMDGLELQSYTS